MEFGQSNRATFPARLFYGIGAQKAGTTWLYDYLSGHPEVKVPGVFKEQQYWSTVRPPHHGFILERGRGDLMKRRLRQELAILSGGARRLRGLERKLRQRAVRRPRNDHRDHLAALLVGWGGEAVVGEITPEYALLETETFAEMARQAPDTRFFFILRDPVKRLISAARMDSRLHYAKTNDPMAAIAEALEDDQSGLLARSAYETTIERLEAAVPRDRIAYFFYETLFQQPEIDRLCDFLGVAHRAADLSKVVFSMQRSGEPKTLALPSELSFRLQDKLQETYDFVRDRFGSQVPEDWDRVSTR